MKEKYINLVDPASSHMLVSKIKPCKCEYKFQDETAKCLLKQLEFIQSTNYLDTNGNSVDNTCYENSLSWYIEKSTFR